MKKIKRKGVEFVSVIDLIDFITQLAAHPHYNPDDSVQQFMLDIKKELEKLM